MSAKTRVRRAAPRNDRVLVSAIGTTAPRTAGIHYRARVRAAGRAFVGTHMSRDSVSNSSAVNRTCKSSLLRPVPIFVGGNRVPRRVRSTRLVSCEVAVVEYLSAINAKRGCRTGESRPRDPLARRIYVKIFHAPISRLARAWPWYYCCFYAAATGRERSREE